MNLIELVRAFNISFPMKTVGVPIYGWQCHIPRWRQRRVRRRRSSVQRRNGGAGRHQPRVHGFVGRDHLVFLSIVSYFPFQGGRGRQLFVGANVQQPRPPLGKATWLWTRWQDKSECQIGQLFGNSSLFVNTRQYKFFAQKLLIQLKCVTRWKRSWAALMNWVQCCDILICRRPSGHRYLFGRVWYKDEVSLTFINISWSSAT